MLPRRLLLLLVMALLFREATGQTITLLTFNIRYDNPADGPNNWHLRKAWLCSQVKQVNPGIFGLQEGLAHQVRYIDSAFTGYRYIGVGRDDGKTKGEYSPIFYNTARYKLLKQSTFWLSETPGKVSRGWDAALERICTCGLFQDRETGSRFWVFNTHLDHMGEVARKNSAALILQRIRSLNTHSYPVVLMGDFNCNDTSEPYRLIAGTLKDSKVADKSMTMEPGGTFNGFDVSKPSTERIDFIFTSKTGLTATGYQVIRESRDGRYASDHFAVAATCRF